MKKIILATLISGAMSASAFAINAGTGIVNFSGSIIEAPCSIAPGEDKQDVDLGQVSNVTLEAGGESSPQPFSIQLQGCNLKDDNQVTVVFGGTADNEGLLTIVGEAQGAGVKIMTTAGTQIKAGDGSLGNTQNYVKGDNELKFQAALKGIAGATVVPGDFTATTNFTLSYQ
ncbi:fimbrial protein [Providencia manganoxydans]|uniref:fimbrial protein n=1 Tax=Providencia manganoxydans TaxID=2923283 RepID=UPI00280CA6A1|nr:type 1 fimbrial protein [Providencia stuartii]ELR5081135.1 type 1 fimbrial protein [Providencia stuartii]